MITEFRQNAAFEAENFEQFLIVYLHHLIEVIRSSSSKIKNRSKVTGYLSMC